MSVFTSTNMNTILIDDEEQENLIIAEQNQPLNYFNAKNYQLENLKNQVEFEKCNFVAGIQNARLSYLMNEYQ